MGIRYMLSAFSIISFHIIITGPGHVKLRSLAARQLTYRRDTLATSLAEVGDEKPERV